jgi:hypothetical protein
MLRMSICVHIYRGRALWGLLVNAADVHLYTYLQGSRPCKGRALWGVLRMSICMGRALWGVLGNAADVHLRAYLQGSRSMGPFG